MEDMPKRECRIGLVQSRCSEDLEENTAKTISGIREAAGRGAQIICTQELFRSTYFCQREDAENFQMAEPIPGPTTLLLQEEARSLGVVIVGSLFEERAPGLFHNTAVVIDADGTLLGTYRKMHIPDDPGFYEKYYFAPGDQGFRVWKTKFGTIGVLICWDQWYPEAARLTALQGAEILFYPTAIGWLPREKESVGAEQRDAWRTIQRSHAIANGCYVAAINRVGHEASSSGDGIDFWGGSFVAGTSGQILDEASLSKEAVLVTAIDLAKIRQTRIEWPFYRDRRIDAYDGLDQRYLG
jgi:N-carbamoylputrescine amidase